MTQISDLQDEDLLPENFKNTLQQFIDMLQKMFDNDINTEDCTILRVKNYIPMFTVFGTLAAAQLGITQEEYYVAVDYYIRELDLIAGENNETQE